MASPRAIAQDIFTDTCSDSSHADQDIIASHSTTLLPNDSSTRTTTSDNHPHPHHPPSYGSEFTPELLHRVVVNGVVFARMSPENKAGLITTMQQLGMYVGMCGDGSNDCMALKAAHIGISLSDAEASIAAPFTYLQPNIKCVPVVLSEGRASLVTSFQLFKFMSMYSIIQFGASVLLYFDGSTFGNWQFLLQDLGIVFPLTIFMGATSANSQLNPKRPSGNLLSFTNLVNIFVHMCIMIGLQILVYFLIQLNPGYAKLVNNFGSNTMECTSVYYFSNFQYLIMAILLVNARPWKKHFWNNYLFTILWILSFLVCLWIALWSNPLDDPTRNTIGFLSDDVVIPAQFRVTLIIVVAINFFASILWEFALLPMCSSLRKGMLDNDATNTAYGRGGTPENGGKPFHLIRKEFEDQLILSAEERKKMTTNLIFGAEDDNELLYDADISQQLLNNNNNRNNHYYNYNNNNNDNVGKGGDNKQSGSQKDMQAAHDNVEDW
jgi:hypothetical protein